MPFRLLLGERPKLVDKPGSIVDAVNYGGEFNHSSVNDDAKTRTTVSTAPVVRALAPYEWLTLTLPQRKELCDIVQRGSVTYAKISPSTNAILEELRSYQLIEDNDVWRKRIAGQRTVKMLEVTPTPKALNMIHLVQRHYGFPHIQQLQLFVMEELRLKKTAASFKRNNQNKESKK